MLRRLRAERADLAVLFPNSFRSALLAWLAGIRRRVGYARGGRGLLLTDRLTSPRDERRPAPADADRRVLPGARAAARLPDRLAPDRTVHDRGRRGRRRPGLGRGSAWLGTEPVVCLNTGRGVRPGQELARRALRGPGATARRRGGAVRPGRLRAERARRRPRDRGAGRSPARRQPGRRAAEPRPDQGVRPPVGPADHDRLRPAALRRRRSTCRCSTLFGPTHIAWTRTYHPQRRPPPPPASPAARASGRLPARPPPLHARADARRGLSRPRRGCSGGVAVPDSRSEARPMPVWLVTGGSGFLGRHVLAALGDRGRPASRSSRSAGRIRRGGRVDVLWRPTWTIATSVRRADRAVRARRSSSTWRADASGRARARSIGPTRWRRSTCSTPCRAGSARAGRPGRLGGGARAGAGRGPAGRRGSSLPARPTPTA